jgi:Na+/H+ antiporter NhaD/arsenite permease-like protein
MVVSAALRLGGFYTWVTRRIVSAPLGPRALLAAVVTVAGVLSAMPADALVPALVGLVVVWPTSVRDRRRRRRERRDRAGQRRGPAHGAASRLRPRGRHLDGRG